MPKMQKYADIRVQDLLTDFSHNNDKTQAARDKAQLGKPVTIDESYFDPTTNQVVYTGEKVTHYNGTCAEALVACLVRLRERHRVFILLAVEIGLVLLFERVGEYRPNCQDFQLLCHRACHALQQRQKQVVMLTITCVAQIPSF